MFIKDNYNKEKDDLLAELEATDGPEEEVEEELDAPIPDSQEEKAPEGQAPDYQTMIDRLQAKVDAYDGVIRQRAEEPKQEAKPQQPQIPQYQATRAATDAEVLNLAAHTQQLYNQFAALQQKQEIQELANKEITRFTKALSKVSSKFNDFSQFVPAEVIDQATDVILQNPRGYAGKDWEKVIEQDYKARAYDVKVKQQDELEKKRATKRVAENRKVTAVPPSGAAYQSPKFDFKPFQRGYHDAKKAFVTELEALGG